jgi:hypothetical protein
VAQLDWLNAQWDNGGKRGLFSNIYGHYIDEAQIAELGQNVDTLVKLLKKKKSRKGGQTWLRSGGLSSGRVWATFSGFFFLQ